MRRLGRALDGRGGHRLAALVGALESLRGLRCWSACELDAGGVNEPVKTRDWFVYILRCGDGTLYTGITVDLPKRLEAHRRGAAAKYTRSRRPVELAYHERQPDRSRALKREAALRRMGRAGKLSLIASRPD